MKKNDNKHKNPPAGGEDFENLENQLKRVLADYQNLEKRAILEKSEWIKLANKNLLLKLLPGLDSLMLAQKHTQDEGITLSINQILNAFSEEGVKKIETLGQDFDPKFMEAVSTIEVDPSAGSGQGEGKVVQELKAGYTLFDMVLRPAQVVVGSVKQNSN